jgi:hypothetical protein
MSSRVTGSIKATPEQVWQVLSDGWLYSLWVVGASRIRDVDQTWPEEGSSIHHSVGCWPAVISDRTTVTTSVPAEELGLHAFARPVGEVGIRLRLEPTPAGTHVTMDEEVLEGPMKIVPGLLVDPMLTWRNRETVRRLALTVEGRLRTGD